MVQLCQKVLPELLYVVSVYALHIRTCCVAFWQAIDSEVEVQGPNECNVRDVKL